MNPRAELRHALLAAAESCWIYAVILTIGTGAGFTHVVSPLGIFIVYWVGLGAGRLLPRVRRAWRLVQALNVIIALIVILIAIRVGLYEQAPLLDLSWLPTYFSRVFAFFEQVSAEEISTIALIYAFVRGLGFAQRPLTLWFVGFQFRLGIVVLFFATIAAGFVGHVDFRLWIFTYFIISLLGIALARIEESGRELALGWKWAAVLLGSISATMGLGYLVSRLFTLQVVDTLFQWMSPLFVVGQILVALIAIPLTFILEAVINLLLPIFELLRGLFRGIVPSFDFGKTEVGRMMGDAIHQLELLTPYFRLAGVMLVVLFVAWLIARALDRRMHREEEETFVREAIDERNELQLERRRRARTPRPAQREIQAENIRRIYAALLAHAAALGLARREAETPLEFLPRLSARFPDVSSDLRAITDAYVAVHYAQRPATNAQVREMRGLWHRVREQMKGNQRRKTND